MNSLSINVNTHFTFSEVSCGILVGWELLKLFLVDCSRTTPAKYKQQSLSLFTLLSLQWRITHSLRNCCLFSVCRDWATGVLSSSLYCLFVVIRREFASVVCFWFRMKKFLFLALVFTLASAQGKSKLNYSYRLKVFSLFIVPYIELLSYSHKFHIFLSGNSSCIWNLRQKTYHWNIRFHIGHNYYQLPGILHSRSGLSMNNYFHRNNVRYIPILEK